MKVCVTFRLELYSLRELSYIPTETAELGTSGLSRLFSKLLKFFHLPIQQNGAGCDQIPSEQLVSPVPFRRRGSGQLKAH